MASGSGQNIVATAWIKIIPTFEGAQQEITDELTTSLQGVKSEVDKTNKSVDKSFQKTTSNMIGMGLAASAIVTPRITSFGKSTIESAVDFENTFSYMGSILDGFSGDIDSMKSTAVNTAKSTIFSVQDVADAMVVLGKAGLDENNIKGQALQSTLNLAAAAEVDLGESADSVVRAMNAFNLTGDDTTRVADALTYSANASTAEVHDLMLGLQQAGSAASVSGWSLEQTVGTLAMFTDSGIKGSDAGTSLKTMLRRLQAPTENAQAAMEQLGLQIYDSNGKMVSFESIVGQLETSLSGLTEEERNHALSVIFGSDASRAAMQLMQASTKGLNDYIATEQQAGIAQQQATARYSEAGFTLERMKNSVEAAKISLGQALLPAVTVIAEAITSLANSFSNLSPTIQAVIGVIGAIAAAAGPAAVIIGGLGKAFFGVGEVIGKVVLGFKNFIPVIQGIGPFIMNAIGAFKSVGPVLANVFKTITSGIGIIGKLKNVLGLLGGPIGIVITAVSILGPILFDFFTKTEAGQAIIQAIGEAFTNFGTIVGGVLETAGQMIQLFFSWLGEGVMGAIDAVANFGSQVGEAFSVVGTLAQMVGQDIMGALASAGQGINDFANNAHQFMSDAGQAFNEFKSNAGQWLAETASNAQQKMGEIGQSIKTKMDEAAQGAQTAWSNMSRIAGEFGGQIKEKAIQAFIGLAQGIQEKMEGAKQLISSAISAIAGIFAGAHFELPHISLPHFSISGSFSLTPPSIPHISVEWYKSGGIAMTPSVVGIGEAGPEAIVPLQGPKFDELTERIADKVRANGVVVNVAEMVVREEADIDRIANRLAQLTKRRSMTGVYA